MNSMLIQCGRRIAAASAIFAAALTSACGKPSVAKKQTASNTVGSESGELPAPGRANRLLTEQSAFLRRHANDPVEWFPWGPEAFEKAKKENRPLLVSIGYASCPWSQKMATESFADPEIARFMNRRFVCVLVDREERPDVNTSFLHYAFFRSKISGWPLHVWLTPGGLPIYQGIYFPPVSTGNVPAWRLTLEHVSNNWESSPDYVNDQAVKSADAYISDFQRRWQGPPPEGSPTIPEVKEFMKLDPAAQLQQFTGFATDKLEAAVSSLPTSKLEEFWSRMTPEASADVVSRMNPVGAAVLFGKLQNASREAAFQRFVSEARNLCHEKLSAVFDPSYGGFGPPPRFAPHQSIEFLVRYSQTIKNDRFGKAKETVEIITTTLDHMLAGGILDQLGGGFHRYSTDIYWAVPQFEKMLYDQGYMAQALVTAAQLTGRRDYLKAAAGVLTYAGRELSHPEGGFYCAEGSSSPDKNGVMTEGAYYVWSKEEVDRVAAPDAALVSAVFGIEENGNLPLDSTKRTVLGNTNILTIRKTPELAAKALGLTPEDARKRFDAACARLLEARRKRPLPTLENKVLTSWTGVAISGFARTGWATGDAALVQRGERAAEFILTKLRNKDGGLLHAFLDGPSPLPGYSEDYATFVRGLIDLYEATGNARWLRAAVELQERQITDLWDKTDGGFFDGPDSPLLFHRMKSMDEASEISAGSSSLGNLVTLHNALNIADYRDKARRILERFSAHAAAMPGAFLRFIRAADFLADPQPQIIVSGLPDDPARKALIDAIREVCRPGAPLLYMDGGDGQKFLVEKVPDLAPLSAQAGKATVHVCRGFKPEKSLTSPAELAALLKGMFSLPPEKP